MNKISARKNRKRLPLLAFIFIVLSIPLAIYALVNLDSFDTRNRASNDVVENLCTIKFPYVNPESIEQGRTVQVQVDANIPGEKILSVTILDRAGTTVFEKEYTEETALISETFTFTSGTTGDFNMLGTLVTDKSTKPCLIEENRSITVITTNLAPEFKTLPSSAKPSNVIKVKDSYEYLLRVEDAEGDTINYMYSFTPDANWLKYSVIEDGGDGKLTIKFTGVPDKPASYLANIFVHDGYNQHLRSQSWVINVDQDVNDVPKVTVYEPNKETSVKQGDIVKISWEGSDLNQITKYELFISQNPANPNTWIPINTNLSHKIGTYLLDTTGVAPGTYQAVVRATDNYQQPATGFGVSDKIIISSKTPIDDGNNGEKPDDGVILVDPQIINISPTKGSKLKNKSATISATLIAGTGAEIEKSTLVFYLDDKDLTKDLKINEISKSEFSIIYSPKEQYKEGTHKVNIRFKDTKGGMAQKDWTFEVVAEDEEKEDVYNIFGFEIPKRTAMIVGGGLLLILLAILVPWILYLLWRGSKDDEYETVYNTTYSPIKPDKHEEVEVKAKEDKKTVKETSKKEVFTAPATTENTSNTNLWTPVVNIEKNEVKAEPEKKVEEKTEVKKEEEVKNNNETFVTPVQVESKPATNLWTPPVIVSQTETVPEPTQEVKKGEATPTQVIQEDIPPMIMSTPAPSQSDTISEIPAEPISKEITAPEAKEEIIPQTTIAFPNDAANPSPVVVPAQEQVNDSPTPVNEAPVVLEPISANDDDEFVSEDILKLAQELKDAQVDEEETPQEQTQQPTSQTQA